MSEGNPKEGGTQPIRSILIVDDNRDLAEPLARMFRRMGYSADFAFSGEEAILYLQGKRPALIILDLMMPGVGGLDVLHWLRSQPEGGSLPVIVYTCASDQELLRASIGEGANEVWLKGTLDFFQIIARVSAYLNPSEHQA